MLLRATALAALAVPALAVASGPNILALLARPIASAKKHAVHVLLPSMIDTHGVAHLYGSGGASAKGYDIQLAYARNCFDASACFLAEFWGNPGKIFLKTRVALAHGITGAYAGISCGASCGPASIQWKESGVLYTIQWRAGTKATMIAAKP